MRNIRISRMARTVGRSFVCVTIRFRDPPPSWVKSHRYGCTKLGGSQLGTHTDAVNGLVHVIETWKVPSKGEDLGQIQRRLLPFGIRPENVHYGDYSVVPAVGAGPEKAKRHNTAEERFASLKREGMSTFQSCILRLFGTDTENLYRIYTEMDALSREVSGVPLSQLKYWDTIMSDYIGMKMMENVDNPDQFAYWSAIECKWNANGAIDGVKIGTLATGKGGTRRKETRLSAPVPKTVKRERGDEGNVNPLTQEDTLRHVLAIATVEFNPSHKGENQPVEGGVIPTALPMATVKPPSPFASTTIFVGYCSLYVQEGTGRKVSLDCREDCIMTHNLRQWATECEGM